MNITILIIIVTCIVSYLCFEDRSLFNKLMHHPVSEVNRGEWYRLVSSGFVHADFMHLGFNMYVLYGFGSTVEKLFLAQYGVIAGRFIYLLLYLVIIIVADIPSLIKHKNNNYYSSIGASGAVSGILFIAILFNPWGMLLFMFVLPIPAIILGILYLVYSSWASKNARDKIAHDAHFYGAIAGIVFALVLLPNLLNIFINRLLMVPF
ncbi:MAG: rhomboid family intramembrane serine protease [Saprospiraceae bacterium]|nr:rhomboid family intramembrane serine protease [Saprospiraceae bacterium]